jgi:hypothetical protein
MEEGNLHSILIEMEDTAAPPPPLPARICISIFLMWKTGQDSCIAFLCLARVKKAKTGSLSPAEFSNS